MNGQIPRARDDQREEPSGGGTRDELVELKAQLRQLRQLRQLWAERRLSMSGLELRAGPGHTTASRALNGSTVPSEATVVAPARALGTAAAPLLAPRRKALPSVPALVRAPAGKDDGADAEFEERYRQYVEHRQVQMSVIGLVLSQPGRASWPLDTSYLSLELAPRDRALGAERCPTERLEVRPGGYPGGASRAGRASPGGATAHPGPRASTRARSVRQPSRCMRAAWWTSPSSPRRPSPPRKRPGTHTEARGPHRDAVRAAPESADRSRRCRAVGGRWPTAAVAVVVTAPVREDAPSGGRAEHSPQQTSH